MNLEQIKKEAMKIGLKDFYSEIRNKYLKKNGFESAPIRSDKKAALNKLVSRLTHKLKITDDNLWENPAFQMAFRVTSLEDLIGLKENINAEKVKACLSTGRELTILPLNVLLGGSTIKKFIPTLPGLYSGEQKHSLDPYGIFKGQDQIRAVSKDGSKSIYLGSRKFDYAVLANITEFCPVGCAECYKGALTRMSLAALADIDPKYAELKKQLKLEEKRAIEQTRLLQKWLNKHPEVDTVIISGGEPLMYSPDTIEKILEPLGKAEHLKVVRICTSAVYQGLFYVVSDELIGKLKDFRKKHDGRYGRQKKHLYFNCHVTDEHQLLTPEARIATAKLQEAGVSIHLQMPLQEGINFYREYPAKSAEKMSRICLAAYDIGAIPYKAIVNMHSQSYEELTVPIERVSETISFLEEHFDTSDMFRWQAYSILHEQGNAYIYAKPHFLAEKDIDRNRGRVTYFIPKVESAGKVSVHTYEEPLLEGMNDQDSLSKISNKNISSKIREVREAYAKLRRDEIDTREFYNISGIKSSKNEPLII